MHTELFVRDRYLSSNLGSHYSFDSEGLSLLDKNSRHTGGSIQQDNAGLAEMDIVKDNNVQSEARQTIPQVTEVARQPRTILKVKAYNFFSLLTLNSTLERL